MNKLTPLAILAALALAACNNDSPDTNDSPDESAIESNGGSATDSNAGGTDDRTTETGTPSGNTDDEFVAACLSASNLSRSMCDCLAEKADEGLSANSRDFLIATLNEETQAAMELRVRMNMEETAAAAMFMANASTQCAREGRQ
ncbi:MAG: hypothetical protein COW29_04295 [Rhodobacterales bacterium CG15_BIG_FIL_POST_REV_8_21_14_020_59_13]|nr:MAG: hypothetical protein COW29_04295 [Rhodobacterales bacterium CG15_BIG_FIL_POST_REV_8_21_14_020_59_13]